MPLGLATRTTNGIRCFDLDLDLDAGCLDKWKRHGRSIFAAPIAPLRATRLSAGYASRQSIFISKQYSHEFPHHSALFAVENVSLAIVKLQWSIFTFATNKTISTCFLGCRASAKNIAREHSFWLRWKIYMHTNIHSKSVKLHEKRFHPFTRGENEFQFT